MADLVIMPAFNEAEALPEVLRSLEGVAADLDVLVVNDGSDDETTAVARAGGATVLELPFNLGIGGALRTGFRYAVDHGYERAVQLDADGQHDPSLIASLLDGLDQADLVIGSRFAGHATSYDPGRTRRRAMRVLQMTLRMLSGRQFTDTSSGFRAFNRPMLEYFAVNYPAEYMESVEALMAAHYGGFTVREIPTRMAERQGGQPSNRSLKLAYHYIRVLATLLVNARPTRSEVGTT